MPNRIRIRARHGRNLGAVVAAAACAVALPVAAPAASAAPASRGAPAASHDRHPSVRVVATGLDNPRGLAFDRHGTLYVAEAGHGGPVCIKLGDEGTSCAGLTGGISAIRHGRASRIVDHLISLADPNGTASLGAAAVATRGHRLYAQIGTNSRALPPQAPPGAVLNAARRELGRTIHVSGRGWSTIASTGDADYDWTARHKQLQPDQFPDANPNGLAVRGRTLYVADAGANLLATVNRRGRVSTLAYFPVPPKSPTDAVPTCVANARDGSLYVGELLGGTVAPGNARVWQVWPDGRARVKWTGFTGIQGCGFDDRGSFYVTEFQAKGMFGPDPSGAVVRIRPNGTRTTFGTGSLFFPSGFAYHDGGVYVSNWSIMPSKNPPSGHAGEVVRIDVQSR
jgi:hypothetical protein